MLALCGLVTKLSPTLVTPWTVARQAPLSIGFSKHEYWSGLPFPFPGDLPNPGIKPGSPALQADFFLPTELPGKPKCEHLRDTKSSIKQHFPNSQLSCYKSIYGTRSIQSVRPVGFNQTDYEKFTDMVFDFILQLVFFKKTIACQVLESTKEGYTILTKKDY